MAASPTPTPAPGSPQGHRFQEAPPENPAVDEITDHGIPVPADETRTAAVCCRDNACRIVIAAKGYLLVVDPMRETSRQAIFPSARPDYPYACFAARDGLFYTGAGERFMAFDPFACHFVFTSRVEGGNAGYSFAEDDAGRIYFTVQGACTLLRYEPRSGHIEALGPVDETETYPCSVALDRQGWIYVGVGTEHKDVIAIRPATGDRRRLIPEAQRTRGAGFVYNGLDGEVYGHFDSPSHWAAEDPAAQWYRFENGAARPVAFASVAPSQYTGHGFHRIHNPGPARWAPRRVDLAERLLEIEEGNAPGGSKRIRLHYRSAGAQLSALAAGPDGRIYGTSGHPLHLFRHDPATGATVDFGGAALEEAGGGNICAFAACGSSLYGALYPGGLLHRIDTARPFLLEDGPGRNPRCVARVPEVYRPRCCLPHPDGHRILFGGYAGYGAVGGGLGIFDVAAGEQRAIPNTRLVPDQSLVSLAASDDGRVYAGTCVLAPGGGHPRATEARLALLNDRCDRVLRVWTPVPGARSIVALRSAAPRLLYLMTSCSRFAVFDAARGRTLRIADLSGSGPPVRDAIRHAAGIGWFLVMHNALLRYDGERHLFSERLGPSAGVEISHAGPVVQGRFFFTQGPRLCSLSLANSKEQHGSQS